MATETLRPNGAGDETFATPSAGANWECVDESSHDSDTSYVSTTSPGGVTDLYAKSSNSIGAGDTINSVTVYMVARITSSGRLINGQANNVIKENGVKTTATAKSLTTSYVSYSTTYTTKPSNGTAWTKTDIDNLQIGVRLAAQSTTSRCTQVYVVVDYTPSGGGGSVSQKIIMPRQAIKRASNY